jgi:hypothetical protein
MTKEERKLLEGPRPSAAPAPDDPALALGPPGLLAVQYRMYQKIICWDLLLEISRDKDPDGLDV